MKPTVAVIAAHVVVAPRAGAWIETRSASPGAAGTASPLVRGRGLLRGSPEPLALALLVAAPKDCPAACARHIPCGER